VSPNAAACPHCGAPISPKAIVTKPDFWHDRNVGAIGVLVLIAALVAAVFIWMIVNP
jgi:hypothetical protein